MEFCGCCNLKMYTKIMTVFRIRCDRCHSLVFTVNRGVYPVYLWQQMCHGHFGVGGILLKVQCYAFTYMLCPIPLTNWSRADGLIRHTVISVNYSCDWCKCGIFWINNCCQMNFSFRLHQNCPISHWGKAYNPPKIPWLFHPSPATRGHSVAGNHRKRGIDAPDCKHIRTC